MPKGWVLGFCFSKLRLLHGHIRAVIKTALHRLVHCGILNLLFVLSTETFPMLKDQDP